MKFRLRTMLVVVAAIAVLMVSLPPILDWVANPPSVPLSRVVAEFNESAGTSNTLKSITEEEVVHAINSQLPSLVEDERVKQVLRRIAKKRRVPLSTAMEYASVPSTEQSVASLSFLVHTGNRRCTIQIRSTLSVE